MADPGTGGRSSWTALGQEGTVVGAYAPESSPAFPAHDGHSPR